MNAQSKTLAPNQKTEISRALMLRDSEFLTTCVDVLGDGSSVEPGFLGEIYENLSSRRWSKLETLKQLLERFGYCPLTARTYSREMRYDIEKLLSYQPNDDAKFVSMLIDFAADRAPTPDEGLQFEQLLTSEQISRFQLLERAAERYSASLIIDRGDVVALPALDRTLHVCSRWRGHLNLHPSAAIAAEFNEAQGSFSTGVGLVFCVDMTLQEDHDWQLVYELDQTGGCLIQIELCEVSSGKVLCRAISGQKLAGRQEFALNTTPLAVSVRVSCLENWTETTPEITPIDIRFEPKI